VSRKTKKTVTIKKVLELTDKAIMENRKAQEEAMRALFKGNAVMADSLERIHEALTGRSHCPDSDEEGSHEEQRGESVGAAN
jgi:hypothetical protein